MRFALFNNTATVDDASTSYANANELPKAQIGIFDAENGGNLDLTGANATAKMIIAQGVASGKSPVKSQILEKSKIERVSTKTYQASQAQKTVVGFNGTDGSIENGAGEYLLKIVNVTQGFEPYPVYNLSYTADADATPYEIAVELAKLAASNPRVFVDVDVLVEEATTQLVDDTTGANVTVDVTKGYDVVQANVTAGEDVDANVGDYIRIGSAADDADPLYKITAIEAGSAGQTKLAITLDRVYAGETDTAVAAGSTSTAPVAGDNAGLTIEGDIPTPDAVAGQGISKDEDDNVVSFRTALSEDFGATEVRAEQAPTIGTGSYLQVESIEKNSQGSESFFYRATPFQPGKPEFFADPDLTYDMVTVLYRTNTTANIAKSNKYVEIVLFFKQGELASAGADLSTFFGV